MSCFKESSQTTDFLSEATIHPRRNVLDSSLTSSWLDDRKWLFKIHVHIIFPLGCMGNNILVKSGKEF